MTMSVAHVYTMSLLIIKLLPLQLENLSLEHNLLEGTLPESWSEYSSVSPYLDTVSDHCERAHCLPSS